jgi:UDP:flavonoid glycosyltransferase YjiC (YdhE family)
MARIAFAWELGGEFGHVMSCAGLAAGLDLRGHRIAFMFRELRQLAVVPEARHYDIFQAPRSPREGQGVDVPASYADILLGCGFFDPRELEGLVRAWRSLLAGWKPDLVVADFAPTALIAARTLGISCVTYGNGFFIPPRASPLPPFRVDTPADPERVARSDARALESVNAVLARLGQGPLARLADLFETREDFLCTLPELDHYGTREKSGYWGPRVRFDRGVEVAWPHGTGKRVFVYVKTDHPQLDELIDVLCASPHRIVAYIPGLDDARRARLAANRRILADKPVKLDRFIKTCDLVVCHAGEIATGALMHGVPTLNFPAHYEQYITARRLEQVGAGGWLAPQPAPGEIARGFRKMLDDPRFAANARAFAQRYPTFSPQEQRRRIVARIEEVIRGSTDILPAPNPPEARA